MSRAPADKGASAAVEFRRYVLGRAPRTLKEEVRVRIVSAVERNLIILDQESGVAVARDPDAPGWSEIPDDATERAAKHNELLDARRQRAIREGALDALVARGQEVEDLNFLLQIGDAQETALEALGVALESASAQDQMVAAGMRSHVALVASGRAPGGVIARVHRLAAAEVKHVTAKEAWLAAAETALLTVLTMNETLGIRRHPKTRRLDGAAAVTQFLEVLAVACADLPPSLREPPAEKRKEAARYLADLHVADFRGEFQPARKAGPPTTLAGAAQALAKKLGAGPTGRARDRVRRGAALP